MDAQTFVPESEIKEEKNEVAVIESNILMNLPDPEQIAEVARRYKKYVAAACQVLSKVDIVNVSGKPFIEHVGCKKIAGMFKLTIRANEKDGTIDYKKIITDKNTGEYYVSISGQAYFTSDPDNYEIYEGTCPAMHGFFKDKHDGDVGKVSLVEERRVQEKAFANFMQRAVKKKLGLNFSWEDLEEFGFNRDDCKGYEHKNNSNRAAEDSSDTKEKRHKTWKMFLDVYQTPDEAKYALERMTTWEKDGRTIKGKQNIEHISEAQLNKAVYPAIKKEHEELFGK